MRANLARSFVRPRKTSNALARSARYIGLFAWVGGAALQAVAVNRAGAAFRRHPDEHPVFVEAVRARWAPVEAAAICAHLVGSGALGWAGRHRAWAQRGMPTAMMLDTAATLAGLGVMTVRMWLRHAAGTAASGRATASRLARADALVPLLAAGSVAAQGYLAEQQRPGRTLSAARLGVPAVGGAPWAITFFGHGPLESALSRFDHATARATRGFRPLARAVGDTAMAAWFGSSLMGVVAVDRAVGELSAPVLGLWAVDEVWDRWTVPGSVAIAAHLLASAVASWENKSRAETQKGMATQMAAKGWLTLAAVAATVAARTFRKQAVRDAGDGAPVHGAPTPSRGIPREAARAQKRCRTAEYAVCAVIGAVVVLDAKMSEEQRPVSTLRRVVS